MADSFRISSGDGKVPDLSIKKSYNKALEAVRSMDPSTAYVVVRAVLLPILSKLSHPDSISSSAPTPMQLAAPDSHQVSHSSIVEAGKALREIQARFRNIEQKLKNLDVSKQSIVDRWVDSYEKSPISSDNESFRNFYYLRENLLKDLAQIKSSLQKLKSTLSQTASVKALIKSLESIYQSLVSKIPEPSSNWIGSKGHWKPPGHKGWALRFWWEKEPGKPQVVFWKDKDSTLPENSIGLLEMVLEPEQKKYKEYLELITKGLNKTKDLEAPLKKDILFEPLSSLNTQEAFMYLVMTLLPALQAESGDAIEKTGQLMKQTSKIFDKYNQIQDEITFVQKIAQKFMDERGTIFTGQDWKDFERFRDLGTKIDIIVSDIGGLLKEVEKQLPPTAQTLISTLREINAKLLDLPAVSDKWDPTTNKYDGKAWVGEVTIEWDKEHNPLGLIESMLDADQTRFKGYIDNLAQAITAMTSISNMTQQEVQIASQYHNSLLGLQKNAYDSINKVVQIATKPPTH